MFLSGCEIEYYKLIDEKMIEESFLNSVDFIINSVKCENNTCFWDCKKDPNNHGNDSTIYSTYIMIWALSRTDLITDKLKDSVVKWVKNNQRDDFLWSDDNGQKVLDSTIRALIIFILTEYIKDFGQVELYVTWLLSKQDIDGSWPYITTDKAQHKDLGVTLGVTTLFSLILNKLPINNIGTKNNIVNSLKKATSWANKKFQTEIQKCPKESLAVRDVAWVLRLYHNCVSEDYSKEDEIYGDIKIGLQEIESWLKNNDNLNKENVQVIYNCLWSYTLWYYTIHKCKIDIINNRYLSNALQFMLNYVKKDKTSIEDESQNKRHIGAFILFTSDILERANMSKITTYSIKEKVEKYSLELDNNLISRQTVPNPNQELGGKHERLRETSQKMVVLSNTFKIKATANFICLCVFMSILYPIFIYYFVKNEGIIMLFVGIISIIGSVIAIVTIKFTSYEIT